MATREQTQELLGSAIGDKYEVVQWIGGGGMAGVYLARHRIHGGFCAVKVLAEHLAQDAGIVQQFLQEARTAANLDGHPNVVRIVDIGENNGLHYLIMQYIEGEDLAAYLPRVGRLTPAETIYITIQVADALRWAHARGVIHRDLKPANVRLDTQGRVIVLDFGIAKVGSMPSALTQMGVKVGTPYYMAPEQIRGHQIDLRADLYALGIMMYQMVIGKRPFDGETNEAIWHAHVSTPPPVPHEVDPAVPAGLSHVILHLLEKDPDKRYQSAEKVVEHLKMLGGSEMPATLRPQTSLNLASLRSQELPPSGTFTSRTPTPYPQTQRSSTATPSVPNQPNPAASQSIPVAIEPKKRSLWPIFTAVAVLLALALGATVWFVMIRMNIAPTTTETPEREPLAEVVHTSTGDMYLISAGEFVFGADKDVSLPGDKPEGFEAPNPKQTVHLPDFYIDATEVTNAAYKQFCDATQRPYPASPADDPAYFQTKLDYPVVNVSLDDAQAFAKWAGKRLPTEQEWEKAARGTDGRLYPWGDGLPAQQVNADGAEDGFPKHAPANALPQGSSPYGLLNMAGNVWEWTSTPYIPSSEEIATVTEAWRQNGLILQPATPWVVIKGGSFITSSKDLDLLNFFRAAAPSAIKTLYQGFRCAMDVPAQPEHKAP